MANLINTIRAFLEPTDRTIPIPGLQPEAKRRSFIFCLDLLQNSFPAPPTYNFFNFGFCTCKCLQEQGPDTLPFPQAGFTGGMTSAARGLAGLYRMLIFGADAFGVEAALQLPRPPDPSDPHRSTFTEFWHAYESSTLVDLLDSKGLRDHGLRVNLFHLEHFLRQPVGGPHEAVWTLAQFIFDEPNLQIPQNMLNEYHFGTLQSPTGIRARKDAYEVILAVTDQLELEAAAHNGQILQVARRDLMRTFDDPSSMPSEELRLMVRVVALALDSWEVWNNFFAHGAVD